LVANATANVTVLDAPEAPRILPDDFFLDENVANETLVGRLFAWDEDADENATLRYAVVGGSGAALFSVNSWNGSLYTRWHIDFESAPEVDGRRLHTVDVRVEDVTGRSAVATANVTIVDLNDPPRIVGRYNFSIAEDAAVDDSVGVPLIGSDEDAGDNGTLTFELLEGTGTAFFVIDPSRGNISVAQPLDYETAPVVDGRRMLTLVASVRDGAGLRGNTTVNVTITDVNERPWASAVLHLNVSEMSAPGT
jgi:hypothetical protein